MDAQGSRTEQQMSKPIKSIKTVEKDGDESWHNRKGQYHREDGPAYIGTNGFTSWWFKGERHRVDGPAVIDEDGNEEWWLDGKLHREDGPAIVVHNGSRSGLRQWWLEGNVYSCNLEWMLAVYEFQKKNS